jgi:hypothetical protein
MRDDVTHRVKYSLYATLIFLLLTNPMTWNFTQTLYAGLSVPMGYLFQGLVFFCLTLAVFMFPNT